MGRRSTTALVAGAFGLVTLGAGTAVAGGGGSGNAADAVFCVGPSGLVRMKSDCHRHEREVTITGEPGPAGPQGSQGPAGEPGAPGAPGAALVDSDIAHIKLYGVIQPPNNVVHIEPECPDDHVVVGGGYGIQYWSGTPIVMRNHSRPGGDGWYFSAQLPGNVTVAEVWAEAICVRVGDR